MPDSIFQLSNKQLDDQAEVLESLAKTLRQKRAEKKLSRRVLAEMAGVSQRYLAQIEAGKGNVSICVLQRVADALDSNLLKLLGRVEIKDTVAEKFAAASVEVQHAVLQTLSIHEKEKRIALIGLRGAGKSSLGKQSATALGIPFIELNDIVERLAGMPIGDIIAMYGVEGYRKLEGDALTEVFAMHKTCILAVSGGIVTSSHTYNRLINGCHTIWLQASAEDHMARVRAQGDLRPMKGHLQAMDSLRDILKERALDYERADVCLNTSNAREPIVLRSLLELIKQFGDE